MTWTWVVAVEVVMSGYILKMKLKGFADWLDVEYERKDGESAGGTVCKGSGGRNIRSSVLNTLSLRCY